MDGHRPLPAPLPGPLPGPLPEKASFGIHEAKTTLSKLVARAEAGEEVTVTRGGVPVARLVPIDDRPAKRPLGWLGGQLTVAENFDDPLREGYLGDWPEG